MASSVSLLIHNTPVIVAERAAEAMRAVRGVREVIVREGTEYDREAQQMVKTGWVTLIARGTEHATKKAASLDVVTLLREEDPNADHDHARCIANAASMGVPAAWAHMPETYLSM